MSPKRLIIIQDLLMHYRVGFFKILSQMLSERGYSLVILTSSFGPTTDDEHVGNNFDVSLIGPIFPLFKKVFFWQSNLLKFPIESSDIVIIPGNIRFLSYLLFFIKCKLKGVMVGFWSHYWSGSQVGFLSFLRFKLYSVSDFLVLYTEREVSFARRNPVLRGSLLIGLNNGLDYKAIEPYVIEYDAWLRCKRIVFSGRLTDKSCCFGLLHALALLDDHDVVVDIIGDGPELEGLKELSVSLGVENRVFFLGSVFDEKSISTVFNEAILFVYPGNVGLSLIHAFAYGLPVVIPRMKRNQCMPEIDAFKHLDNGFYFVNGSWKSLALTIDNLIRQPSRLNEVSVSAKCTARSSFNSERMARRLVGGLRL